jgi:tRNA modification GTPase
MIDASQPIDDLDRELWKSLDERPRLVLRNKSDLIQDVGQRSTLDEPPEGGYLDISALSGEGLERLKSRLLRAAGIDTRAEAQACLPNRRHRDLLIRSLAALGGITAQPHDDEQLETMAIDLMDCERCLNQILGVDVTPDVLDDIFKRFCIGK